MKPCFSTLACPDWTLSQVVDLASRTRIDAIELRFIENEDSLWKLPVFSPAQLAATKRLLSDHGLTVACVDTSCRFHSPEPEERRKSIEEGERMAELAAALHAPGIRVFGDKIQKGADRDSTRNWIGDSIAQLAAKTAPFRVEVWIETHGDFASGSETAGILRRAGIKASGAVWDPANCVLESHETPTESASALGLVIRHVHIKDLRSLHSEVPALPGGGVFPMREVLSRLYAIHYDRFVSFEWEKKWHPEIPDADAAVARFAQWWSRNAVV